MVAIAGGLLAAPFTVEAQQPAKTARLGFLTVSAGSDPPADLLLGLRELGWVEGQNLTIESPSAVDREDRLATLAVDLVPLRMDLIVTSSTQAALAAKRATTAIPIVVTFVADPVGSGLVASLARPAGNVTGVTRSLRTDSVSRERALDFLP
jgi:putative ABC transport system substrate-binding protein